MRAAELFAPARQLDRAALAIDLHSPELCPTVVLRLLEEELVLRAAQATADEMVAARAVATSLRHHRAHRPRLLRWRRAA
jgi:hypothetical protein